MSNAVTDDQPDQSRTRIFLSFHPARRVELILGDDAVVVEIERGELGDGFRFAGAPRAGLVGDIFIFRDQAVTIKVEKG